MFFILNAFITHRCIPKSYESVTPDAYNEESLIMSWLLALTGFKDAIIAIYYIRTRSRDPIIIFISLLPCLWCGNLLSANNFKFSAYMKHKHNRESTLDLAIYAILTNSVFILFAWDIEFTIRTFIVCDSDIILMLQNMTLLVVIVVNYIRNFANINSISDVTMASFKISFLSNYFTLVLHSDTTFELYVAKFIIICCLNLGLVTILILQERYGARSFFVSKRWRMQKHE